MKWPTTNATIDVDSSIANMAVKTASWILGNAKAENHLWLFCRSWAINTRRDVEIHHTHSHSHA